MLVPLIAGVPPTHTIYLTSVFNIQKAGTTPKPYPTLTYFNKFKSDGFLLVLHVVLTCILYALINWGCRRKVREIIGTTFTPAKELKTSFFVVTYIESKRVVFGSHDSLDYFLNLGDGVGNPGR